MTGQPRDRWGEAQSDRSTHTHMFPGFGKGIEVILWGSSLRALRDRPNLETNMPLKEQFCRKTARWTTRGRVDMRLCWPQPKSRKTGRHL